MTTQSNLTGGERLGALYQLVGSLQPARDDLPLFPRVVVRNTGSITWPNSGAYPINLSYHWLDLQGQSVDFEGVRAALPIPLPPGQSVELELWVEPPPRAGSYLLAFDMVEEEVGWFSDRGVPPLTVPVDVAAGPPGRPRAVVVGALCLPNDAVGNHMIHQLRFFQERGYQALMLVEHTDARHPMELRRHMFPISYGDIESGRMTPLTRRALEFFRTADVFVFQFPLPYPLFEAITLVERGVAIVDYHGVTPARFWESEGRENFFKAVRRQMRFISNADYAIAHSEFTRDELLRTGAVAPERVYQMAYAVPLERFRPGPRPQALLARYGLAPDQPLLLYVGRMAANKCVTDLVRALVLVRAQFPNAALLLVGDDRLAVYAPVADQARRLARELGVAEAVIFAGMVPDDELPLHYQLADVFVTASVHEGFCIPVLEAMACGLPVVGAHATALPETIGEGGLTFHPQDPHDLADKVIALLSTRPSRGRRPALAPDRGV